MLLSHHVRGTEYVVRRSANFVNVFSKTEMFHYRNRIRVESDSSMFFLGRFKSPEELIQHFLGQRQPPLVPDFVVDQSRSSSRTSSEASRRFAIWHLEYTWTIVRDNPAKQHDMTPDSGNSALVLG